MAEESGRGGMPLWLLGVAGLAVIGGLAWWSGQQKTDLHSGPEPTEATSPKVPGVGDTPEPDWLRNQREAAEVALQANPKDLLALNTLTQIYIADPPMAMKYNKQALEVDGTDADARVLRAVISSEMAMHDKAIAGIEEVIAEVPDHPRAMYFRGIVLLAAGQPDEAVPHLEAAIAALGEDPGLMAALASATAQVAAPGDPVVSGTLELPGDGLGAVVFVSAFDPAGGPPLASLQLPNGPYPMQFSLTTGNAIAMGGEPRPFPEVIRVTARLDQDGNAGTKVNGEPSAEAAGVALGTEGLSLTLQ